MIPVTAMVAGKGTVSFHIKGRYGKERPSNFSSILRPIVFWNITYKCNLKCKHCYIRGGPDVSLFEVNTESALKIAEELVDIKVPLLIFTGGEPLLRSDFWKIAGFLAKKEMKMALSSNGTLISRSVAKRLKDLGFKYIGISLDSIKPKVHDEFRGVKGSFEKAVDGIRNAVSEGIPVGVRTTITKWNINEVDEIVDFCKDLGVKRVTFYILDTIGRGTELVKDLPSNSQLKAFADNLIELSKRYSNHLEILVVRGNFIGIYIADKISKSRSDFLKYLRMIDSQGDCGRKSISIYPDGTVRPCQFIDYYIIGDLKKESLKAILSLDNKRLRTFIYAYQKLRGKRCSKCPFRKVCGGGSRNRALVLQKDFWGDDPLCIVDYESLSRKWEIKGEI